MCNWCESKHTNRATQLGKALTQIFSSLGPAPKIRPLSPPTQPEHKNPPGLYLSAGLANDGTPLVSGVSWLVFKAGESSKTRAIPLKRSSVASPVFLLPGGPYHIEVRYKSLLAEQDVQIRAGKAIKKRLSFNVGALTASARLGQSSPLLNNIIFSVYDISSAVAGPANLVAHQQETNAVFYLPPGKYALKASANETWKSQTLTLKAGDRQHATLLLDAGLVGFESRLAQDTPILDDVQYTLFQRRANSDVELIRTLDPTPALILEKGEYFILAQQGSAASYSRFFVQVGETKKIPIILNAGLLQLSSNLEPQSNNQHTRIAYTIEALNHKSPKTIRLATTGKLVETDQALPTRSFRNKFVLRAGEYRVRAFYGNSNATATADIKISAGQTTHRKISLSAGRVRLSLTSEAGSSPLPGVFWSILDKSGKQVASASTPTPQLTLSKGAYQVIADYLGQSYRRDITVESGAHKNVQLELH